ncbi:KAP family NTPase [Niabella defluvii]|nr:KAP family NTPase [Niabella sp. I65]
MAREATNYALLINGVWGSGKTHFWKHELENIALAANIKPIYISLNGVAKTENLGRTLFIRMLPYLQKDGKFTKWANLTGKIVEALSKSIIDGGVTDLLAGTGVDIVDYSKYIVCLDDLERCQIPVKELLGFINNYVEHKSLKVVILADESKLKTAEEEYDAIKEKTIGRVLNFQLPHEKIFPQLSSSYKSNTDYYNFLKKCSATITTHFSDFGQKNLRVMLFILDILERLQPFLKDKKDFCANEVIFLVVSISCDFKEGKLQSNSYNDFKKLDELNYYFFARYLANAPTENESSVIEGHSYVKYFSERYLQGRVEQFHFYPSVYSFILSGYLDEHNFREELANRKSPEVLPETIAYAKLINYNFRDLENTEFNHLVEKVIDFAKRGAYSLYDYAQIADFYFFFSDRKIISLTYEDIWTFILQGLEAAVEK